MGYKINTTEYGTINKPKTERKPTMSNLNTIESMNSVNALSMQNIVNYIPLDQPEQYTFTKEMFDRLVEEVMNELNDREYDVN